VLYRSQPLAAKDASDTMTLINIMQIDAFINAFNYNKTCTQQSAKRSSRSTPFNLGICACDVEQNGLQFNYLLLLSSQEFYDERNR
jgi:hypothetical protein